IHEAVAREAGVEEWRHERASTAHNEVQGSVSVVPAESVPKISVVVVLFNIPRQAENTVYSLTTQHQRNVRDEDYEIIVVENASSAMLGEERALGLGKNVRYFRRDAPEVSPAPAVNFGVSRARARTVGLMIDGARMATPRLIEHAL